MQGQPVGALRASIGLPTTLRDLDRLVALADELTTRFADLSRPRPAPGPAGRRYSQQDQRTVAFARTFTQRVAAALLFPVALAMAIGGLALAGLGVTLRTERRSASRGCRLSPAG